MRGLTRILRKEFIKTAEISGPRRSTRLRSERGICRGDPGLYHRLRRLRVLGLLERIGYRYRLTPKGIELWGKIQNNDLHHKQLTLEGFL